MGQDVTAAIAAWDDLRELLNLTELARRLGLNRNSTRQWRMVPTDRVGAVSKVTGIPPHRLRPDQYPPPSNPMPWNAGNSLSR